MIFQRQCGLPCGLHAAYNAVGERLLVAADLNLAADEIGREMALRAHEAQRRSSGAPKELAVLQKRIRKVLVGPAGGQWAADCVIRALAKRGQATSDRGPTMRSTSSRRLLPSLKRSTSRSTRNGTT
jgi:hypothetical protein